MFAEELRFDVVLAGMSLHPFWRSRSASRKAGRAVLVFAVIEPAKKVETAAIIVAAPAMTAQARGNRELTLSSDRFLAVSPCRSEMA